MRKNIEYADEVLGKYFPVLDNGFVALVDYMGGDESIEKYARVSYGHKTRKISDTRGLIRYLIRHHHSTPIESTELAFHIALPVHVSRQMIRHRTFSPVNEYSGRYSVMPDLNYTPEKLHLQSDDNKQGSSDESLSDDQYEYFMNQIYELRDVSTNLYHNMLNAGVAREVARMDLPLSTYTFWYCKMDLNNLFKMLRLRLDSYAQSEIRQYAKVMAGLAKRVAPLAFEAFVDYQLCTSTLTRLDKKFLDYIMKFEYTTFPEMKLAYETIMSQCEKDENYIPFHKQIGMGKRELSEFWNKFDDLASPDFDLNLSLAKDAKYYEDVVLANSR